MRLPFPIAGPTVLAVLALAAPPSPGKPSPAPSTPGLRTTRSAGGVPARPQASAFERQWERASEHLSDQHWDRAREALLTLIDEHRGNPELLLRRPAILEGLQLAGFWRRRKAPEAEDLVRGKLLRWRPRSGEIALEYGPDDLTDFDRWDPNRGGLVPFEGDLAPDTILIHPARFAGPHSLRLEGRAFPPQTPASTLFTCFQLGSRVSIFPGYHAGGPSRQGRQQYLPATIRATLDGEHTTLASDTTAALSIGRPYALDVQIDERTIRYTSGAEHRLEVPTPSIALGQVGFMGFPELERVRIEGRVEPGWLEGLVDQEIQTQWLDYLRKHPVQAELPSWFRMPAPQWSLAALEADLHAVAPPAARPHLRTLAEQLRLGASESAERLAESVPADVPDVVKELVGLHLGLATGRWSAAEGHADALLEGLPDPASPPGVALRLARAEARHARRDFVGARADLDRAAEDTAANDTTSRGRRAWIEARRARNELGAGNLERVSELLSDAARAGRYGPELDELNRTLTKAANGPAWRDPYEYRTGRYVLRSDLDRRTCLDAGRTLTTALGVFERWIRPLPAGDRRPFQTFIHSGQFGYLRYLQDLTGELHGSTAGLYIPSLRQLVLWNAPVRDDMFATLRHEGFHQYFDCLVGDSPLWLNEGLAELFGAGELRHFNGRDVPIQAERLALLRSRPGDLVPLARFLTMDRRQFWSDPGLHYAQAWALVHMLYSDSRSGRHVLFDLIDALGEGLGNVPAVERAFARQDLERLDARLAAYVAEL